MKAKFLLCLALAAFTLSVQARLSRAWSDEELTNSSDLVLIGQPVAVKRLAETNSLGWPQTEATFHGLETTFRILAVCKGDVPHDLVVVHHYGFDKMIPPNAPNLKEFQPADTNLYELFLVRERPNRYAPTTGQVDPVFKLWTGSLPASIDSLRVKVVPSATEVRVNEPFKVALSVENPTSITQTIHVMSCSWYEEWLSSNTNVAIVKWGCGRNGTLSVAIPPGGEYAKELDLLIPQPVSEKTLSFRMGFTGKSEKTYWSDEVQLNVVP